MKKVMILGANNGQIPFINICKSMGAEVMAVSVKGNYPGFVIADKCYYCDIRDKDKVLKIARDEKVDAVLTDQTDVSVPTAAFVSECLGLPGIGYDTAMKFSDKYIMRCEAQKAGVAVPKFGQAGNYEEAERLVLDMRFPVMVKPTNSSGSRGVRKIYSLEELKDAVGTGIEHSGNSKVIIEEFIQGKEYIVDGLAINYQYINTDLGIKEYFDKPNMYISKMCMFSSAAMIENENEREVLKANEQLVKSLGLKFGITHGEYIYCEEDKKVYLVELAARGGGVYLSSHLTPISSGIRTNEILIDYVLNDTSYDLYKMEMDRKVAAWRCFELMPGIITNITGTSEVLKVPGVFKACLDGLYEGREVYELTDDTRKHGPILVSGSSRADCYKSLESIEKALKIETTGIQGVQGIRW